MRKVMIIGNGGGGKTRLAYFLAQKWNLPLTEIDTIQFSDHWQPVADTVLRQAIKEVHSADRWLIDGFGPWDLIEARAGLADTIVFVDHPIWVHFWWACERQIAAALGEKRLGGPQNCDLRDVTKQMFETLWRVHEELRPKLAVLMERQPTTKQIVWIRSPEELNNFYARVSGT